MRVRACRAGSQSLPTSILALVGVMLAVQRLRRKFAEESAIVVREAAPFPDGESDGDVGDVGVLRISGL